MGRKRLMEVAHQAWEDWAEWIRKSADSNNCLGYPSSSPEARAGLGGGGQAGSRDPEVMASPRISRVSRLYGQIEGEMRTAVYCYYIAPKANREALWIALTGKTYGALNRRIDQLHWMTMGAGIK